MLGHVPERKGMRKKRTVRYAPVVLQLYGGKRSKIRMGTVVAVTVFFYYSVSFRATSSFCKSHQRL